MHTVGEGALPLDEALKIAIEIADGLGEQLDGASYRFGKAFPIPLPVFNATSESAYSSNDGDRLAHSSSARCRFCRAIIESPVITDMED